MKQLGGMDASFLYMETPQTPMHVGGLSIVELPAGFEGSFYDAYKAHLAARLHLVPVLRKKLMQVPWDIDHPLWVDDDEMELDYHIRQLGLPKPGTMKQLEELVGRLHSNFLDRSRPLWEFYVIDGLPDRRAAIYTKIHHAAIDGGAGMALTQMMYDATPEPRKVEPALKTGRTREPHGTLELLDTAYRNMLDQHVSALRKIPEVLKAIASIATPVITSRGLEIKGAPALRAPKTMLNGSITSQRSFAACSLPLAQAKAIAKQTETKLNDVVMAVCAGALRRYLQQRQELPNEPLVALVPVSLREAGNTESKNLTTAMLCSLATDIAEPLARLKAIHASSLEAKEFAGKIKDATPRDFSFFGAPLLLQGAIGHYGRSGLADRLPPQANVCISNVPGPQAPLYLAGAEILTLYPVNIPTHGMALNMTVQSYHGALDFGLVSCRRSVPELRRMADYLEESLRELHAAAIGEAPAEIAAPVVSPRERAKPTTARTVQPEPRKRKLAAPPKSGRAAKSTKQARPRARPAPQPR